MPLSYDPEKLKRISLELQEIENKIRQVLRIARALDKRKIANFEILIKSKNVDELKASLNSLNNICKRESRILEICEGSVKSIESTLNDSELLLIGPPSHFAQVKYFFRKKIRFLK